MPAASWASKRWPFSARPTAARRTSNWPTKRYCIGGPRAGDSYLKIDRIISAAEIGNVQAIHPGYGFLAENAHFADVCRSCDYEFIGPTHEAMGLVGDKNAARKLAKQVNVPCVPGSEGLIENEAQAVVLARELGFPVLIKASAGGGGRGMRVAINELALRSALQQAQAEAEAAFGNPEIYLEKYVEHPRHVEVQVLADTHGNVGASLGARLHDAAAASEAGRGKSRPEPARRKRERPSATRPCGWSRRRITSTPARSSSSSISTAIFISSK